MGSILEKFFNRLIEFQIKRKPICFHLQKNFTTTGEEKFEDDLKEPQTDSYDDLQNKLVTKLTEVRTSRKKLGKNWYTDTFPDWDKLTIDNLNYLFTLFASSTNGKMDFQHFSLCLDSLFDKTSSLVREEKFKNQDADGDGFINYDEFLLLIYNFDHRNSSGSLQGLPKTCIEIAETIRSVNSLSAGEQLQYGLF